MAVPSGTAAKNGHLSPPRDLGARWRRVRYNPIRNFTPERLTGALEQFDLGYLRDAALLWDVLERRDDVLKNAGPKRRKSVSRQAWEIVASEEGPEASRQKEALEYFYRNITVTSAVDENLRAGFPQLVRGMMDAQFHYYAVHEVVWRPGPDGLTAELRKVPLWFFENRTGKLRYTGPELAWEGQDLDEDGWLVTCGDGIMEAASVCCMFKRFSLQDWLNFGEKFGIAGIHGECAAAKGSAEWDDFVEALESFANDWIIATAAGSKINLIEAGKTGDAPFQPMVDRMDRRLAALCRGADLSSISRDKEGTGASLQGDETDTLVEDDCALITETLNEQIDKRVIRLVFGPAAPVLANVRINPPKKRDIAQDLNVDRFLLQHGAPVAVADALERYGRPAPDDGEEILRSPRREQRPPVPPGATGQPAAPADASNESNPDEPGLGRFLAEARELLATAMHADLQPVREALKKAIGGDLSPADLQALRDALPGIMAAMDSGDTAAALAAIGGSALADGIAGGPEIAAENEDGEGGHWITYKGRRIFIRDKAGPKVPGEPIPPRPRADSPLGKTGGWKELGLPDARKLPIQGPMPKRTSRSDAITKLDNGFTVQDPLGTRVLFDERAAIHVGAAEPERATFLGAAEQTIRDPLEIWHTGTRQYHIGRFSETSGFMVVEHRVGEKQSRVISFSPKHAAGLNPLREGTLMLAKYLEEGRNRQGSHAVRGAGPLPLPAVQPPKENMP